MNNTILERQTYQKKIILDFLKNTTSHPSAEIVYQKAKKKLPNISKGTVYRLLKNFKEKGEIQELPTAVFRYDGDNSSHAHFICKNCGKIFDIFDECKDCKILKFRKTKVGKIRYYQIYFHGYCKTCQK